MKLVSAFFLAPAASAAAIAIAVLVATGNLGGPQDDGKSIPNPLQIFVFVYPAVLFLSIPLYFLVSRLKWTALRSITLAGALVPSLAWLCLSLLVFRNVHAGRILVLALGGAAWGIAFWRLAFRTLEEPAL